MKPRSGRDRVDVREGSHTLPLQASVGRALEGLGVPHASESTLASGYSLDFVLGAGGPAAESSAAESSAASRLALEEGGPRRVGAGVGSVSPRLACCSQVDGPNHFTSEGAPSGATRLKRRQLRALGWTVLSVPHSEWARRPEPARAEWLRQLLASAAPGPPAPPPAPPAACGAASEASTLRAVAAAFAQVDGYGVARDAKRRQRESGVYLEGIQYGEVDPSAFAKALGWVSPADGERFVDLGSGTGKAVLTAAALHRFRCATGVELLEPLHAAAQRARAALPPEALRAAEVRLLCGDAFKHPWAEEGGVVFCTLTCLTDEAIAALERGCERLPRGARLIVTTRELKCHCLRLLRREKLPYGKGSLLFLAYERV